MESNEITLDCDRELTNIEGNGEASGEQQKRKYNLSDLDSEDESDMEVSEAVVKRFLSQLKEKNSKAKRKTVVPSLSQLDNVSLEDRDEEDATSQSNDDRKENKAKMEGPQKCKGRKAQSQEESDWTKTKGRGLRGKAKEKAKENDVEVKKWTNEETCMLIDLFEERPCLWDVFDKNYHMRDKRDMAFKEIEAKIDFSVAEIKAKISKLRSQLVREISKCTKTKSGQSTDELYKPTWTYWHKLQFLRPVMQPGKSRDNLQDQDSFHDTPSPAEMTNNADSSLEIDEISQGTTRKVKYLHVR